MWAAEEISDDDDKDIEEMQKEVEDILSKITAKKRKTTNTDQVPLQFSVKVEVEEYNEQPAQPQLNKPSQNNQNNINKTNNPISLLEESQKQDDTVKPRGYSLNTKNNKNTLPQTPPSTSVENTVLKPSPTILNYNHKSQYRSEETHYLINNEGNEIIQKEPLNNDKYNYFSFGDNEIKDEMEKLSMLSTNPVDKHIHMLAKNIANVPTPVAKTSHESALDKVLLKWRDWYLEAPDIREAPSQYKCRTCGAAWWHLSEFREHLERQHNTYNANMTLKFQSSHHESYITARKKGVALKTTLIDTPCWRCGLTSEEKFKNYNVGRSDQIYSYTYRHGTYTCICRSEHPTCTLYRLHLDVCEVNNHLYSNEDKQIYKCHLCFFKFTSSDTLTKHKMLCHSVRSDVPCAWPKYICKMCNIPLENISWHDCPKMKQEISCCFCIKRFTTTAYLNLHYIFVKDKVKCRYCDHIMLKGCMELEHLMEHTENYILMYKCRVCEDNKFFLKSDYYNAHLLAKHPFIDKTATVVPVPVKCLQMSGYTVSPEQIHNICIDGTLDKTNKANSSRTSKDKNKKLHKKNAKRFIKKVKSVNDSRKDLNRKESLNNKVVDDNIEEYVNNHKEIDEMILYRNNKNVETILDEKEIKDEITENLNDNSIDIKLDYDTDEKEQESSDCVDTCKNIKIKEEIVEDCNIDEGINILTNINDLINDNIKMEIKEEPDHEFFEDDIIILNENSLGHVDITDDGVNSNVNDENNDNGEDDNEMAIDDNSENSDTNIKTYRRLYTCKRCNFEGTYNLFKLHRETHHKKKMSLMRKSYYAVEKNHNMKCSRCKRKFQTLQMYVLHLVTHKYPKLTCPECRIKVPFLKKLIAHVAGEISKSIIGVKSIRTTDSDSTFRYLCKKCHENVKSSDIFQHWEQHLVMPGDEAKDCNWEKYAPDIPLLREAIALLLGVSYANGVDKVSKDANLRCCKICNKGFGRRNDCMRHYIEHLLENAYENLVSNKGLKCQICGQLFFKNSSYKSHMRYHASLPVYKCELCNKSFSDSSNFAKHKKVHNIAVLTCDICKKKFNLKDQLIKHIKIHKTLNPIVCDVDNCKRKYYSESHYRRHCRQVHLKQAMQYICIICKERFMSLKDKWDHQWTVHRVRKIVADCPMCKKQFRMISDVKRHLHSAHYETVKDRSNMKRLVVAKRAQKTENVDDEESELVEVTDATSEAYMLYL